MLDTNPKKTTKQDATCVLPLTRLPKERKSYDIKKKVQCFLSLSFSLFHLQIRERIQSMRSTINGTVNISYCLNVYWFYC